jgi:hypothetical protein
MKIHIVNVHCGAKGNLARCTSDPAKVTCRLCQQYLAAHRAPVEAKDGAEA